MDIPRDSAGLAVGGPHHGEESVEVDCSVALGLPELDGGEVEGQSFVAGLFDLGFVVLDLGVLGGELLLEAGDLGV